MSAILTYQGAEGGSYTSQKLYNGGQETIDDGLDWWRHMNEKEGLSYPELVYASTWTTSLDRKQLRGSTRTQWTTSMTNFTVVV